MGLPLRERKRILDELPEGTGKKSPVRLSDDLTADGNEVFKKACALGAEGIVSKLASAKYTWGRMREDKPAKEAVQEAANAGKVAKPDISQAKSSAAPHSVDRKRGTTAMKNRAITHPDKVLDAESGMTKRELAEYYEAVAEHLLPHIADRPLSVVRCPDGTSKPCFFQKHVGFGLPDGVKSVSVRSRKTQKREDYLTVDSIEGLAGLAQMDVIEIHPWGSRNGSLEHPDRIVFDLDLDAAIDWKTLAETAKEFKRRLAKMDLESFVKSTGGKGLHVVVPIRPDHEWPVIKEFAHNLALNLEQENPELYVTKMTKATRKNRIYLDYLRNDREATSVAPYSPRARSGTPVAMPLRWSELSAAKAPAFHVMDFKKWRQRLRHDPWAEMLKVKQKLPAAATE